MENIRLIKKLEKVSSSINDKLLKIKGYVLNDNEKENLEIIIYKGFSSSTTHKIDPDDQKDVIHKNFLLVTCQLLKAPLSDDFNKILKEVDNIELFLNADYWN